VFSAQDLTPVHLGLNSDEVTDQMFLDYLFSSLFFGGFIRTWRKLHRPQKAVVRMNEVKHVQNLEECLFIRYFNLVKRNAE